MLERCLMDLNSTPHHLRQHRIILHESVMSCNKMGCLGTCSLHLQPEISVGEPTAGDSAGRQALLTELITLYQMPECKHDHRIHCRLQVSAMSSALFVMLGRQTRLVAPGHLALQQNSGGTEHGLPGGGL